MATPPSPRLPSGLLALVLAAAAAPALAQDRDGKIEMGAVDIESLLDLSVEAVSRRPERASGAPAAVFVVTADDVRRHGFRSLQELLGSVPGLFAYPDDFPQVGIRGMGILGDLTTRVLVLVDGHPLNNAMGVDLARGVPVPLDAVERVEVIEGPVGSVYGPSAFFGVVNLVTSATARNSEVRVGGDAAQGEVRAGEATATWRGGLGSAAVLLSAHASATRGMDWTFPEAADPPTSVPGGKAEHLDFGDDQRGYLRLGWSALDARAGCARGWSGLPGQMRPSRDRVLEGLNCLADVSWRWAPLDAVTLTPRVSVDHVEQRATRSYTDAGGTSSPYAIGGHDRWYTAELRADWRPVEAVRLDAGLTVQDHDVLARASSSVPGLASLFHRRYQVSNGWVQAEARPVASLALDAGLTMTRHSLFHGRVTPRAAVVWQPTGQDTAKAIWSNGFRPPTILEAFVEDDLQLVANPELRPERVTSVEVVYEHRFAGTASLATRLFWNRYRDLIVYEVIPAPGLPGPPDPTDPSDFRRRARNGDGLEVRGVEVAGTIRWGRWLQGYGGASLQEASAARRPNFPQWTANLALSSRAVWRPLLLSVRATAMAARAKPAEGLRPGERRTVPPALSLAAHAALDVPGVPGLVVELSVANALDARNGSPAPMVYRPVTELPQAARTWRADLRWRF